MPAVRTDLLIAVVSVAVMLVVRFWAATAGAEILGLVTLLRIVVGAAILGAVVAVISDRPRSGAAMVVGATIATVIASIFTRGGFDPEAAAGASLMAALVAGASFIVIRRILAWVAERPTFVQALLGILGVLLAIGLIALGVTAR